MHKSKFIPSTLSRLSHQLVLSMGADGSVMLRVTL